MNAWPSLVSSWTRCLDGRHAVSVPTMPVSAEALTVLAVAAARNRPVVWVGAGPKDLETMHADLTTLLAFLSATGAVPVADLSAALLYFPAWDVFPLHETRPDPDLSGYRLRALSVLGALPRAVPAGGPLVLATCVPAFLQKTLSAPELRRRTESLAVGGAGDLERLTRQLSLTGYSFVPEVEEKGQVAVKGGIVDVWPVSEPWPIRVELAGASVESLRLFNPVDQRSVDRRAEVRIPPASELPADEVVPLLEHLPHDAIVVWSDCERLAEQADLYEETVAAAHAGRLTVSWTDLRAALGNRRSGRQVFVTDDPSGEAFGQPVPPAPVPACLPADTVFEAPRPGLPPDAMEASRHRIVRDLVARRRAGQEVLVFLETPGSRDHFRKEFEKVEAESGPPPTAGATRGVNLVVGVLSGGFVCEDLATAVVAESDLYGGKKTLDRRYAPVRAPDAGLGDRLTDLTAIEPGDIVVHVEHGRGRYLGLYEILFNGRPQEVLTVEYADKAKLHVPVTQAHLLSRFVGISPRHVELNRLGTRRWTAEKDAAEQAAVDLASSLLQTQAERNLLRGHAFAVDRPWQREFEASFPFRETDDQRKAIADIKHDMESARPMDRLVCGDAGYGKTEVAIRAAFKAVLEGTQVALLVPTTILAQQHYQTFRDRMAPYPVRVEMLSRFVSRGRQTAVLEGMRDGTVDIVVGTHALLQSGVAFHNLGLVIIDEEQRFGVLHKEHLKQLRRLVDVLTLTATPIPRTLYLSMTGAREMSLIQTPPRERQAVETIVARNTDDVVRDAVLRELRRGGQVFYLHNRILTIDRVRERLQRAVPEARVEVAHGRMPSSELAAVVRRFAGGGFDVLLCTTIIETGTDIPRANTILIDRADRFGMADLYQLRGRVGRSNRKAYAYLLLPPHGHVDPAARKRIGAMRKFSTLSIGFKLALRDLEIRGAGNLLGAEQSGHVNNVGFGLYCQLLRQAIARLQGGTGVPVVEAEILLDFIGLSPDAAQANRAAILPYTYIEDERLRIGLYRKIASLAASEDVAALRAEIQDRFGPLPPPVQRLLKIADLRIRCSGKGVSRLETDEDRVRITRRGELLTKNGRLPRLTTSDPDRALDDLLSLISALPSS